MQNSLLPDIEYKKRFNCYELYKLNKNPYGFSSLL